jgi:hypothetical protein
METTVTLFDNRTLQKVFLHDGIKAVLNKRKSPLRLENEKDGRVFFSDVQDYIIKHDSRGLYTTYPNIMAAFKKYGVNNGVELIVAMFDRKEQLEEQGYDMSKIKDPMELIKKYNVVGRHSYIDMDTTRTLVVRSKYGNYPVLFYDWNGPICDCPAMWAIKLEYHYQTGCKYFETRPILYSTWMELPKELQNASCVVDSSDMEVELETV